jgi:hypothetical protein
MQLVRLFLGVLAIVATAAIAPVRANYRYCNAPCIHQAHQYDLGPCSHPCYSPFGPVPCHPNGDVYPCVHKLHPWDVVVCGF